MPKSKRNRVVPLSKVAKKVPNEKKSKLYTKIQNYLMKFKYCYVFTYKNMTNIAMNALREYFKDDVFCIGKNKVMQVALGKVPEEEKKENSHKLSQFLKGNSGLFFSDKKPDDIVDYFNNYACPYFGKSGTKSNQTVILKRGYNEMLDAFPTSMESQFRQLGLKLKVDNEKFCLLDDYVVCKEGTELSPDQAKMCQHLGIYLDEFKIYIKAYIGLQGEYKQFDN